MLCCCVVALFWVVGLLGCWNVGFLGGLIFVLFRGPSLFGVRLARRPDSCVGGLIVSNRPLASLPLAHGPGPRSVACDRTSDPSPRAASAAAKSAGVLRKSAAMVDAAAMAAAGTAAVRVVFERVLLWLLLPLRLLLVGVRLRQRLLLLLWRE